MRGNPKYYLICVISICIGTTSCEKKDLPVILTSEVTNITDTTAISGGTITSDGGKSVTARGVCWSVDPDPTIKDEISFDGAGGGSFISNITNLFGGTQYYVRAYATNDAGTGYGMTHAFTTSGNPPMAPSINHLYCADIRAKRTMLITEVNPNYLETTVTFEYGETTSYGKTIAAYQNPIEGHASIRADAIVYELDPITTYHFRAKAENEKGTTYSEDKIFTTLGQPPSIRSQRFEDVSLTGARLAGEVLGNYLGTAVTFEYGLTTAYGISITADQSPLDEELQIREVSVPISDLTSSTVYHFRIKAINELGTTYSSDMKFTTFHSTISDIDGNVYFTVQIGTQLWMAENLKTTKYRDGTNIPNVNKDWETLATGAYCWYNCDAVNKNSFGGYYNWYAVADNRNLCPTGWHVPSADECRTLIEFLGKYVAGTKIKSFDTWLGASVITNESGFSGLAGGYCSGSSLGSNNSFFNVGDEGTWWSSTSWVTNMAFSLATYSYGNGATVISDIQKDGENVRCVKD